jgi:hypothetical protein
VRIELKERLAITRQAKEAIRSGYAWPGGYPLALICRDGGALCTDCARKEWRGIAHDTIKGWRTGWDLIGVDVLWEGGNYCDHCNKCLDAYPSEDEQSEQSEQSEQ